MDSNKNEPKYNFLRLFLNSEELNSLNDGLQCKIEDAYEGKVNEHLVEKALHETSRTELETKINALQEDVTKKNETVSDLEERISALQTQADNLNKRVQDGDADCKVAEEARKKMEYEWRDIMTQRDLACDEKNALLSMIDRSNSELLCLKTEKAELKKNLEAATRSKLVALENAEEVESMKISLGYKEKRIEQRCKFLEDQVQTLSNELAEKVQEILEIKRNQAASDLTTEWKLHGNTEEVRIARETINELRENNEQLTKRTEKLLLKLSEQRESADLAMDNFHEELAALTKLTKLYKEMSSENDSKTEKMAAAVEEMRKMLAEASEKYGDLETKFKETSLNLKEDISKRDECIEELKKELRDANDLLQVAKQENLDAAVSSMSPSAAAASRLIKSGMTLTQIYTQFAQVSECLLLEKEETRRLTLALNTIVNEIESKAPLLRQQRLDYEKAMATADSLTNELDIVVRDSKTFNQEMIEAKKHNGHLTRENERLKKQVVDLSRQVCYLVKAVEEARGGVVSHDTAYETPRNSAQEVISQHLVTFSNIEDLQENNQKLLALVRQLGEKYEAIESVSSEDYYELKTKKEKLDERVTELVEEMDRQSKMLDLIRSQSDMYKQLYQQAMGGNVEVPSIATPSTPIRSQTSGLMTSTPYFGRDSSELQKKLADAEDKISKLEKQLEIAKTENREKESTLNESLQKQSSELKEHMYNNSKLAAAAEYNVEKRNVMELNLKTLQKQIQALEERNRTLSEICGKHEQSIIALKDQLLENQSKLSRAEVRGDLLQQENFELKSAEARLTKESEILHRDRVDHSLLMSNLEGLKTAMERSESEGKLRLEIQLSDALKECSALRMTLKDDKDRFKELSQSLERQTLAAKDRMLEEKALADKARADLSSVQDELNAKLKIITELNSTVRDLKNEPARSVVESVTAKLDVSTQRVKSLEKKVEQLDNERARLQIQLSSAVGGSKQYAEIASKAETNLREMTEKHHMCSIALSEKEKECTNRLKEMERRLFEYERKVSTLKDENQRALQMKACSDEEMSSTLSNVESSLHNKDTEMDMLNDEIKLLNKQLTEARDAENDLKKEIAEAEAKYSQEVISHSKSLQALDVAQQKIAGGFGEIEKIQHERDDALNVIKEKEKLWSQSDSKLKESIKEHSEQITELEKQNASLHNTLQKLNEDLVVMQHKVSHNGASLDSSLNTSGDMGNKAQDELVRVIKFLRKEKDLATTKCEVVTAEIARVKTQLAICEKELNELRKVNKELQSTQHITERTSAQQVEILRKVESLNALTDSNRLLREERDRYREEVETLKVTASTSSGNMSPLQSKVKTFKAQIDSLTTENKALLADTARWKSRATALSERAKTTPEDWRRLNAEKENLAKQCQIEKSNNSKLDETVKKLRLDLTAANDQSLELRKQLQNETNEVRRLNDLVNNLNQKVAQFELELGNLREQVKKLTDDAARMTEEATTKDATLTDLRARDIQIKKIAKKYKTQFEDLSRTVEDEKTKRAEEEQQKLAEAQKPLVVPDEEQERLRGEGRAQVTSQLAEIENRLSEKVKELEARVSAAQEESEGLRKDNETLKTSINEKEERAKQVLKTARSKIAQLSDQKGSLEQEIQQFRGTAEQERDGNNSKYNTMKASYDAMIARLEDQRTEQADLLAKEVERNKELNQRILQLMQQKPCTSTQSAQKSTVEPPTANIKPMAGYVRKKQAAVKVYPTYWSSEETPYASIRPVPHQAVAPRTIAPSTSAASGSESLMVPPQQQVHTTGSSGEALSSSPTSSHTDYMPATSSAAPIRVVVAPLSAQSSQDEEMNQTEQAGVQPPVIALILPMPVGTSAPEPTPAPAQASSSNSTVTTTQAGLKRPREADGDSSTSTEGDHSKPSPQGKRMRVAEVFRQVTNSEVGEEYQMPTSSQRDQEDEIVIMIDSEDDGNADDADVEEPDDEQGFQEEDNGEGYEPESYSRDGQELEMVFDVGADSDDENPADGSNEVEIIDDSNEVPNQSGGNESVSCAAAVPIGVEPQQQSSEATSSGNDSSADHVVVSHAASSQPFRTRSVPPLTRSQASLQSYDEGGDDSIVPSTPTLFMPRRGDGFGEVVRSPQVPHQRFTFSEPGPGTSRRVEDSGMADDPGAARSVPTTPAGTEANQNQLVDHSVTIVVPNIAISPSLEESVPCDLSASGGGENRSRDGVPDEPETVTLDDDNVTSEGEKLPAVGGTPLEEGREAEASEPITRIVGTARRSGRPPYPRRGTTRRQIPTIGYEAGSSGISPTLRTVPTARGSTPRGRSTRGTRRNW